MSESSSKSININPWTSINDMLKQNRCWLCQNIFPKGKQKKVFQVFNILQYFALLTTNNENCMITNENLLKCFNNYAELKANDNINTIINDMKENNIDTWMSGLICNNEDCTKVYNLIMLNDDNESSNKSNGFSSLGFSTIPINSKDCPPGCGCDNPWAFIS